MSLSSQYNVISSPLGDGLHKDGKRLTPQRLKVLNLFENIGAGKHLSAEEVHEKLVKLSSKVSLATIYRTLRLLLSMIIYQKRFLYYSSFIHKDTFNIIFWRTLVNILNK